MTDIVERLRDLAHHISRHEIVDAIEDSALLNEAADTIEQLRSLGIAAVGPSFAELTKDAKREVPQKPLYPA